MDKELLRIVIIATGLLIIVGMLIWSFIKGKNSRRGSGSFEAGEIIGNIDKSLIINTDHDDFDIVPLGPAKETADTMELPEPLPQAETLEDWAEPELPAAVEEEDEEPAPRFVAPEIIQFSIVPRSLDGFNGLDLQNAFQVAGLEYGPLKIFERVGDGRSVQFRVANMVSPGTFPEDQLESFYCPGVVCFMQPAELDDAATVFEDYLETVELLAAELDGDILDHQRQPLTVATVQLIRQSL